MSIVTMKRLTVIAPKDERRKLLRALYRLGCVEIETAENEASETETSGSSDSKTLILSALSEVNKIAPHKKSLLSPKREISEEALFSEEQTEEAIKAASEVNELMNAVSSAKDEIAKAENHIKTLQPWEALEYPLSYEGTKSVAFLCATLPAQVQKEKIDEAVSGYACSVDILSSDSEQHYLSVLVHKNQENELIDSLKPLGFVKMAFKENATPLEEISILKGKITELRGLIDENQKAIASYADKRELFENACDACAQEKTRDDILSAVVRTRETVVLKGWTPEESSDKLEKLLSDFGCAWSLDDPEEGDNVPTALKNGKFVAPFNMITDMYGMPAYNSIVDPNPLITPFYIVFFGFIMADLAYGLIIFAACLLGLKLMKPKGGTKSLLTIFMYCGLSSAIAGALLGGFFADVITVFSETFFDKTVSMPVIWFDPLKDPMTMLIFSLVLGAVQILFSMGVSGYRQIKRGDPWGAFFDVGSWYLIFGGLIVYFALSKVGLYIAIAGVALLLIMGGRGKKGIGRITGGFSALYSVTGYLSDLLSYSRIMALALSGAVVGQVVNKMGTIGGRSIIGFILFLIVFLIGHTFNIAISVLGAYVHTSRLQYVEFFGRFYEGGGRAFKPLKNNTIFVNIREE